MERTNSFFSILVVDDTPKNIQLILTILRKESYQIHVANNGLQALKKAQMLHPDLILLDIMMPGMDGFETCTQLKSSHETNEIPIIFLTARTETEDIVKGFELGAVDYVTKPFNTSELLARVHTHLELKQKERIIQDAYQKIKKQQEAIQQELEQAKKTQQSLLPQKIPDIPDVRVAVKFSPMEKIGGDFYDIFELEKNLFGLMIADVTGHGVSAALLSFMFSSFFSHSCHSGTSPAKTISLTNKYVFNKIEDDKFASMFYAVYNSSSRQLTYTSAGHPPGLILRQSTNEVIELQTRGILVGCFPSDFVVYEEKTIQLYPKDRLLFYTDGIIEVFNKENQMLGSSSLKSFLLKNKEISITELLDGIYEMGADFSENNGFGDDITMLGFELV
ncbi:MAG: SpoIIE family protein phosphatase [SAR324 cluster bacterium]|nr:SpoIIE family protein phosphatase [SAR324 cluster bacterium]